MRDLYQTGENRTKSRFTGRDRFGVPLWVAGADPLVATLRCRFLEMVLTGSATVCKMPQCAGN